MPRTSLYSKIGEDRYTYVQPESYICVPVSSTYYSRSVSRARSVSREPSVSLRSSSLQLRSKLNDDLSGTSDTLESANKSYHEMHAQFLSKRWENKHVYCGIQDHVVDQTVQLNRVLRLLGEEEMALYNRCHIYDSPGNSRSRRFSRTPVTSTFDPFKAALEQSSLALKRHKEFEMDMDARQRRGSNYRIQSINELSQRLNSIGKERREFSIPKDYSIKPEFSRPERERSFKDFSVPPKSNFDDDDDDSKRSARSKSSSLAYNNSSSINNGSNNSSYSSNYFDKSADKVRGSSVEGESNEKNSRKQLIDKIKEESEEESKAEEERKNLLAKSREKTEQERLAREKEEAERLEKEKAEKEKERERLANEREEKDRLAREQAEQEKLAKEKAEKERLLKEKAEQEEAERIAREKEEFERKSKEKAEQERLAREEEERKRREEEERKKREEEEERKRLEKEEKARKEKEAKEEKARKEKEAKEEKARKEREEKERIKAEAEKLKKLEQELMDAYNDVDITPLKDSKVVFVIGGPGSGKGTQCEKVVEDFGYTHLSTGDLLRAEVNSGSERGQKLNELMKLGRLVPSKVVLSLLKEAMVSKVSESKGFLIDGYPRQIEQGIEFEKEIVECELVLYVEASDETMKNRILNRGKTSGRVDDNEAAIEQRLQVFHQITQPVVDFYEKKGKLKRVNAERVPEEVYTDVQKIFEELDLCSGKKLDMSPLKDSKVLFVIGGPGSGKGTQCEKIVEEFGYTHLSTGDLLRAEVNSGSERGEKLNQLMKQGKLVPNKVILELVKEAMLSNADSKGFLIDGYPRQIDQGAEFEREIVPCELVLYIEASDETMKKRLLKRGLSSGRVDDNADSIIQRLDIFHQITEPVVEHYEKQGKLKRVDAEKDPDDVFEDIRALLDDHNEYIAAKKVRKVNVDKIDETVDKIVHLVIKQASNRQEVKEDVSYSIHHAIRDVLNSELEPDEESGFSFLEYENLEIYQGPTKLLNLDDIPEYDEENKAIRKGSSNLVNSERKTASNIEHKDHEKHGEIIIRVLKGDKVTVRADEDNDTVISNINRGEIIIRNVDTNLLMSVNKDLTSFVEMSIVGQAYIRDLSGVIKAKKFRGIVLVRTDL